MYLHAGSGPHDGAISAEPPRDDANASYFYDPDDPVPTLGGNHSSPHIDGVIRAGPVDQRPNESRPDVLIFTSEPVDEPLEVTGPVTAKLYAASSACDTDFVARLIDVYPDGTAFNLTEGILRARFRESIWEPPRLLEPGRVYEFTIDMMATSNVFLPGHRIRVHVTSSNFPLWEPQSEHRPRAGPGRRGGNGPADDPLRPRARLPRSAAGGDVDVPTRSGHRRHLHRRGDDGRGLGGNCRSSRWRASTPRDPSVGFLQVVERALRGVVVDVERRQVDARATEALRQRLRTETGSDVERDA